jgi:hypothetical protein
MCSLLSPTFESSTLEAFSHHHLVAKDAKLVERRPHEGSLSRLVLQRELVVPVEDICLVPHARPERLLLPTALAVPIHIEVRPDVPEVDRVDCHGGQDGVTALQVGAGDHALEEPGAVELPIPLSRIEIRGII